MRFVAVSLFLYLRFKAICGWSVGGACDGSGICILSGISGFVVLFWDVSAAMLQYIWQTLLFIDISTIYNLLTIIILDFIF